MATAERVGVIGSVTSTVAVDWSGDANDRGAKLWLAHCVEGELVELSGGWSRKTAIEHVIALASRYPKTVVGLDFSFGFPAWFVERRGWDSPLSMWLDVGANGEEWLSDCRVPFWGRPGCRRGSEEQFRRTERDVARRWSVRPSSTFQIGGAGSVGTGSLRGMAHLATLVEAGGTIWPFTGQVPSEHGPVIVELYPRLLTGPVAKSNAHARRQLVDVLRARLSPSRGSDDLLTLAAANEDAFDAAVSALGMYRQRDGLAALAGQVEEPATSGLEGEIWQPTHSLPDLLDLTSGR